MTAPASDRTDLVGAEAERVVFRRVLCGLDSSPQGLEAVQQADVLQGDRGSLTVVSVLDVAVAANAGWAATWPQPGSRLSRSRRWPRRRRRFRARPTDSSKGGRTVSCSRRRARSAQRCWPLGRTGSHVPSGSPGQRHHGRSSTMRRARFSLRASARPARRSPRSIVAGLDGSRRVGGRLGRRRGLADRLRSRSRPVARAGARTSIAAAVHADGGRGHRGR